MNEISWLILDLLCFIKLKLNGDLDGWELSIKDVHPESSNPMDLGCGL